MEMLKSQDKTFDTTKTADKSFIPEGGLTRQVESVTARGPSIGYLSLAVGSMVLSAGLMIFQKKEVANFVGLWAPSLLVIGLYNKLVKVESELLNRNRIGSSY